MINGLFLLKTDNTMRGGSKASFENIVPSQDAMVMKDQEESIYFRPYYKISKLNQVGIGITDDKGKGEIKILLNGK